MSGGWVDEVERVFKGYPRGVSRVSKGFQKGVIRLGQVRSGGGRPGMIKS